MGSAGDGRVHKHARRRGAWRWWRGTAAVLAVGACALAPTAHASDLFTLDSQVSSFAPIVADSAGNGYVTWLHAGNPGSVMFCKLPRGARSCAAPVTLPTPGGAITDEASQPFPILATDFIYVVAPRYVDNDTLIYRSADGGKTFSLWRVPKLSYSGKTGPEDVVPTNTNGTLYSGGPTGGSGQLYFEIGASNPGLGFSFSTWEMTFPQDVGVPGFGESGLSYENVGAGLVGGSTLGGTSSGELVNAYWLESTPPVLAYFRWSASRGLPNAPGQGGWVGPTTVSANGYLPRLSSGPAGMFMLSADGTSPSNDPGKVDVRKYDPVSHTFGGPANLFALTPAQTSFADGGGLDENATTGELAAVWPVFGGAATVMRLYVSTNGGASFAGGQEIATIDHGYAIADNARVALASDGSGFLTFREGGGIRVADLYPLATQFKLLSSGGGAIGLPLTCTAPHGHCHVIASITAGTARAAALRTRAGAVLARGSFDLAAGASRILKLRLTTRGRSALRGHRKGLKATLTLTIGGIGAAHTTTAAVTIR
jgi:hypothetical protein